MKKIFLIIVGGLVLAFILLVVIGAFFLAVGITGLTEDNSSPNEIGGHLPNFQEE